MKHIEIDEELYQYLASQTQYIGESASSILRRLLSLPAENNSANKTKPKHIDTVLVSNTQSQVAQVKQASGSVFHYINKEELATQRGVVGRFLLILSALHRVHSDSFSVVIDIRGRDRLYFARSEQELAASGSSTKPRQIPDSSYWVMTNSNTTRKKMMITEVAKALGYQQAEIEQIRDLL
ncbi:replication initiation negative regulator SeqA [Thalassotalea sp. G2M2-11]|uniref:replication initiation negative regulator SeqA n=1 Tax=Thalassotalea sp. G2M2-11 TaxID=2787627 RepID=UPI0019D18892|nr:replication initiation negative regulator SeqA [Thalassotalea sp. G2M2-11]